MKRIRVGVRYRDTVTILYLTEKEAREIHEIIEQGISEYEMSEIVEILSKARKRKDVRNFKVDWFIDITEPEDEQFDDIRLW